MAKEPVVIPSRPGERDPTPPHVIFLIGCQRFKIQNNIKIMLFPNRPAKVIRIDRKSGRLI